MYFQLLKLILWPRIDSAPRIVEFKPGVVNIISGASKTGKSAVIPIIDYCLAANKCSIPVGVIRENCAWFGVVVDTVEGQKLFARREPGDQQSTGDMLLLEGDDIKIPERTPERNTNAEAVKTILNRLSGLTELDFEPNTDNGYRHHPSFRDLMAFTFQPQNVVANPDVMFFKADTTEHREKLKTIFPYVLGAVTPEILQTRFEIDRLNRVLKRKENELRAIDSTTGAWRAEAQSWLRQTIELGLRPVHDAVPEEWEDIVDTLREIVRDGSLHARPTLSGIDVTLSRLSELRRQEAAAATALTTHRQRLNELRRLRESSVAYGSAMKIQRDRLALSDWIRTIANSDVDDPISNVTDGQNKLQALCNSLSAIEIKQRSHPAFSDTLDKEILKQRASTETVLEELNLTRREIVSLERHSDQAKEEANKYDRTERFLGRLEQALQLYDRADQTSEIRQEVNLLRDKIKALQSEVGEWQIRRKLDNALEQIKHSSSVLIPQLDAEWPEAPIRLIIEELTIKVVRGTRDDFLWEIGSGANWLAYHIALTLSLQKYFLEVPHHPVPGMLIYDQPSQVYFPKRIGGDNDLAPVDWKDKDIIAVRKVFKLLADETLRSNGKLQILVLDHADEEVWGELDGIALIEEWRGSALVPFDWISQNGK